MYGRIQFNPLKCFLEKGLNSGRGTSCVIEFQYACNFGVVLGNFDVNMEKFHCIAVLMDTLR